jgi:dTDP-4-amino-4,6-dideoxygalactose transaminase
VTLPDEMDPGHVYHLFVVRCGRGGGRSTTICSGIWPPADRDAGALPGGHSTQPALAGTHPADCPRAASVCDEVLSLPLHPHLGDHELARIAAAIGDFSEKDRHE